MTTSPSVNQSFNVPSANVPAASVPAANSSRSGATAVPAARAYEIDVSHSSATFKVRHMMVANVRGELGHITGQVVIDEGEPGRSSVEARIEVATINTRDPKRDEHLRSGDFLDIANFPQIAFKSKRVTAGKGDNLFVVGDLTVRGVTREVTLDVESISPEVNDPWGNVRRGVAARARINRKDFNIVWNAALDGGGVVVGDEIAIDLELELTRKP
ncbi:MAG: YceI family protein [Polyangia bacterium]